MSATTKARPGGSLLDRAWEAVPELARLTATIEQVTIRQRQLPPAQPVPDDEVWLDDLVERLDAGQELPVDLGAEYLRLQQERQAHNAGRAALHHVLIRLQERRRATRGDSADRALTVVRTELHAVLEQAGPVLTALGPVRDAEAAMVAGSDAVDLLRQARELLAGYDEIRAAQAQIVAWALAPPDSAARDAVVTPRALREQVATVGAVRNYRELQPTGEDHQQLVTRKGVDGHGHRFSETLAVNRQGPADGAAVWPTGDPLADLLFLTGPDAEPWVPTIGELQAAQAPAREDDAAPRRSLEVSPGRERALRNKAPRLSTSLPTPVGGLGNPEF